MGESSPHLHGFSPSRSFYSEVDDAVKLAGGFRVGDHPVTFDKERRVFSRADSLTHTSDCWTDCRANHFCDNGFDLSVTSNVSSTRIGGAFVDQLANQSLCDGNAAQNDSQLVTNLKFYKDRISMLHKTYAQALPEDEPSSLILPPNNLHNKCFSVGLDVSETKLCNRRNNIINWSWSPNLNSGTCYKFGFKQKRHNEKSVVVRTSRSSRPTLEKWPEMYQKHFRSVESKEIPKFPATKTKDKAFPFSDESSNNTFSDCQNNKMKSYLKAGNPCDCPNVQNIYFSDIDKHRNNNSTSSSLLKCPKREVIPNSYSSLPTNPSEFCSCLVGAAESSILVWTITISNILSSFRKRHTSLRSLSTILGNRLRFVALILLTSVLVSGATSSQYGDAEHITAILGEAVVLNCPVSQPDTPYIIQWKRQHMKIPIYIWYDGYDPHVEEAYKGRASRVNQDTTLGLASLNLTSVKEEDQGWYECKVFYLDRTGASDNGTWIHLDVHAPPRFTTTPDDVTYVNIGDSIILNCEAEGTPKPEIFWFRDDNPVQMSDSVGIFNDGTELRINKIRDQDIGDYLCVARNAEGRVHHEAKVVIAGGAVIVTPPHNITRQEGEKAEFPCEAKALPGNVTVIWKREDVPINRLSWLDTRSIVRRDGTLIINPTSADDGGFFTCEVSNGIGTPQRATAYLNVEYPARVTYTPTVQYLPFRQQGIVKCHIKANPEVQFVTWIKDKRLFEPDNEDGVVKLKNGSLLFTKVNQSYQGRYSCTPYNKHTTAGSSGDMEVLVREPPEFHPRPQPQYHGQLGEEVTLVCGGRGSPTPTVNWRRRDGQNLPRERADIQGGNLTIKSLLKSDHAYYECEVKNEILAILATTQLLVEGTTPHPPYNITTKTSSFSVELSWQPGYPGGRDWVQKYTIWYRTLGSTTWSQIDVKPPGSTSVAIHNLTPGSTYEFQVQGKNELGDGMFSDIVTATTEGEAPQKPSPSKPTPVNGLDDEGVSTHGPPKVGPMPAPPRNVSISHGFGGYTISWLPPLGSLPIASYDIEIKANGNWKNLKQKIVNETSYTFKKLTPGKTYQFRVFAKTLTSYQASDEITFSVEEHDKEKAVTAALVGGMLLCIVAIILSVCTVKICNKRKRKKQEKAYSMVACRVSDTRGGGGGRGSPVPLKNQP